MVCVFKLIAKESLKKKRGGGEEQDGTKDSGTKG